MGPQACSAEPVPLLQQLTLALSDQMHCGHALTLIRPEWRYRKGRSPRSALCLLENAMTAASDQEASSGEARPGGFGLTTPLKRVTKLLKTTAAPALREVEVRRTWVPGSMAWRLGEGERGHGLARRRGRARRGGSDHHLRRGLRGAVQHGGQFACDARSAGRPRRHIGRFRSPTPLQACWRARHARRALLQVSTGCATAPPRA